MMMAPLAHKSVLVASISWVCSTSSCRAYSSYRSSSTVLSTPAVASVLSRRAFPSSSSPSRLIRPSIRRTMLIDDEWVFSADSMSDFDFSSESRMLVFDKDGTLGDCIATMHKWIHFMTEKLSAHVSDREIQEYHRQLGWDGRKLVPSAPLAADTWEASIEKTARFLRVSNAYSIVDAWHRELGDLHGQDQPIIEQLPTMLETCRAMGWKIAVCTSDQREPTNQALKAWGIDSLVQYSICGDEVSHSKPSPVPLYELCDLAGVRTENCIVIGDTTADTGMARNSGAYAIGVLTGSGTLTNLLDNGAHAVVPDVGHLPQFLEYIARQADNQRLLWQPPRVVTQRVASSS